MSKNEQVSVSVCVCEHVCVFVGSYNINAAIYAIAAVTAQQKIYSMSFSASSAFFAPAWFFNFSKLLNHRQDCKKQK